MRKGLPEFENTWESADKLKEEFAGFLLEDKKSFEGEGIDKNNIVYTRRQNKKSGGGNSTHN
jgi:hypothetical protein